MKHFLISAFILLVATSAGFTAKRAIPTYQIYSVSKTLTLSIKHDAPIFQAYASPLSLNYYYSGGQRPFRNAVAYMLWDKNNLYILYLSSERDFDTTPSTAFSVKSLIWPKGDFGEVTLKPCRGKHWGKPVRADLIGIHASKNAYHATLEYKDPTHPSESIAIRDVDVYDGSARWRPTDHIRVAVQGPPAGKPGTWKVEMKIPFVAIRSANPDGADPPAGTDLKKAMKGDVWRLQIVRFNRGADAVPPKRRRPKDSGEDASTPFPFGAVNWDTRWDLFGYVKFNAKTSAHRGRPPRR